MQSAKIYKIVNDINTKIYVGQTWRSLETRFKGHCSTGPKCDMRIARAIRKYGRMHFQIVLLHEFEGVPTQEEVDELEVQYGLSLNTLAPNGYSLKLGKGRGKCSEETKRKISESNKGKAVSNETRQKLSLAHLGKKHSLERIERKRQRLKGVRPSVLAQKNSILATAKHYKLLSPTGIPTEIYNMSQFCSANNLSCVRMCRLSKGQIQEHKGWRRIEDC